jgi:dephospho-CoA kinase
MERNGYPYDDAAGRINSQPRDEEYLKLANEVLYNNGSVEELEKLVVKLFLQKKQEWQR